MKFNRHAGIYERSLLAHKRLGIQSLVFLKRSLRVGAF